MKPTKTVIGIWLVTGVLLAVVAGLLAKPMLVAWRCHALHAGGEEARAEVIGKEPGIGVAVLLSSGAQAGESCLLKASEVNMEAIELGEELAVVPTPGRPGDCALLATIEASEALLTSLSAAIVALLLGLVLAALLIQRSVTQPPALTTRMDVGGDAVRCPRCEKPMTEGYLPLLAGLHWREPGEPTGLPHALAGLPGTVGWRGRPRLHAFRCESCEVLTLRYGKPQGSG